MDFAATPTACAWRDKADRLRGEGDASGAVLAYGAALALDPFAWSAWLGKGKALEQLGQDDQALDHYDIATSLGPHSFAAVEAKGLLLHKRGAFALALECFESATLVADGHAVRSAWALNYRAATLIRLDHHTEAIAACEAGLALCPLDVLWLTRGNALRDLGLYVEAIASHNQAIALNPRCVEARFNRALVEEDQGHMTAAIRSYRQCLDLGGLDGHLEQRVRRRLASAMRRQVERLVDASARRFFPADPRATADDD